MLKSYISIKHTGNGKGLEIVHFLDKIVHLKCCNGIFGTFVACGTATSVECILLSING